MEVHDVRLERAHDLGEFRLRGRVVEVQPAAPVDGVIGGEPVDRDRLDVAVISPYGDVVEGVPAATCRTDPSREDPHVVASACELERATQRHQRAPADEVRWEVR